MNTRIILITSALTGIGRATALAFAREGGNIVVHQPKQTAMKLVSAAFIVTVDQNDLGPDLVLFPALEMLNPSKPDHVFLEAAPCFRSNALLLGAYGNPTIFAHPVENGGSRKKTVSFRNAFDWLGSENTGSKTAHFIIRNCYRSRGC